MIMAVTPFLVLMVQILKSQIMTRYIILTSSRAVVCGLKWGFQIKSKMSVGCLVLSNVDNSLIGVFFAWDWSKSWVEERTVIEDGIYGADAPLKVRAQGTIFPNHKTKLRKREYMLGMNTATVIWDSGPFSIKHSTIIWNTMKLFFVQLLMTQLYIQYGKPLATES